MRKIPTLFVRDPENMSRVLNEVNPAAAWVLDGKATATRKYDGTCVMLAEISGWWARREVKPGKTPPPGFVGVDIDPNTGKTMGWEPIQQSSHVKAWQDAVGRHEIEAALGTVRGYSPLRPGTYELCGPKVNGNPEGYGYHRLIEHATATAYTDVLTDYEGLREWLQRFDGEGIVWHDPIHDRMAKIKRRDFGLKGTA